MSKPIRIAINIIIALVVALFAFFCGIRYEVKYTTASYETYKTLLVKEYILNDTDAYMEKIYLMGIRDGVYSTLEVPYDRLGRACYEFLLDQNINPSYSFFYEKFQFKWHTFLREHGYCEAYPCDDEFNVDSIENKLNY